MSNDASYIVRAEHGLLVVNINSRKVDGTISVCDFKKALFDLSSHKNNTAKTKPI